MSTQRSHSVILHHNQRDHFTAAAGAPLPLRLAGIKIRGGEVLKVYLPRNNCRGARFIEQRVRALNPEREYFYDPAYCCLCRQMGRKAKSRKFPGFAQAPGTGRCSRVG